MRHRLVAAAATLCVAAAAWLVAAPTPAAADTCEGVWVIVDRTAFGGGVTQRCAPGNPTSGAAALQGAGHTYKTVQQQPGFICRIDGAPTLEDDACVVTPPASAHWSYWWAEAGGSWTKSSRGVFDRNPAPGQAEGWRFGDGSQPPNQPPPPPPPEPEPEPGPGPEPEPAPEEEPDEEPSSGSGGSGGSGSSGSGGSGSSGSSGGSGGSSSSGSGETSSGSASPSTSPAEGSSETEGDEPTTETSIEPAEPADEVPVDDTAGYRSPNDEPPVPPEEASVDEPTDEDERIALPDRDDDGVPVGLITGGGLIAGLAGLTAFQVRRRRLEG